MPTTVLWLQIKKYVTFCILSNLSILSVPDEGYSRNVWLCTKFDIYDFITTTGVRGPYDWTLPNIVDDDALRSVFGMVLLGDFTFKRCGSSNGCGVTKRFNAIIDCRYYIINGGCTT
jgi:hypothetical protein